MSPAITANNTYRINNNNNNNPTESPGIIPSIPRNNRNEMIEDNDLLMRIRNERQNRNLGPIRLPYEENKQEQPSSMSKCSKCMTVIKRLFMLFFTIDYGWEDMIILI
eukprot:541678_1